MPDLNYYEVLGVPFGTSPREIKRAYKKMAELHHPDRLDSNDPKLISLATEEMILINEAKDVLLDPETKRQYDLSLDRFGFSKFRPPQENGLVRTIVQAQNILSTIKHLGIEISEAEKYFFQAKYAFQNRYYPNGLKLLEYAVRAARESQYEHTAQYIILARETIVKAEAQGFVVDIAKKILLRAKPVIKDGKYKEAHDIAQGAMDAINEIKKVQKPAPVPPSPPPVVKAQRTRAPDSVPVAEQVNKLKRLVTAEKLVSLLNDYELKRLKDAIESHEKHLVPDDALDRDLSKISLAFRYRERMISHQQEIEIEKKIMNDIRNKEKEKVPDADEVNFDFDLDEIEYIREEDIPQEDMEFITVDWDENAIAKKIELYRSVLEHAWDDGIVTDDEDAMLRHLRGSLQVSEDVHIKIEKEILDKVFSDD